MILPKKEHAIAIAVVQATDHNWLIITNPHYL